jgi:hypothetical protein
VKIITVESEIWWLVRPDDVRPIKGISIHDIIRKIQETFSFALVPKELPAQDKGLVFREGFLRKDGNTIPIKAVESYQDGVHIIVDSNTDDADLVFKELRIITIELGGKTVDHPILQYHVSTIVCEFENDISGLIRNFDLVSELISSHLDVKAVIGLRGVHFAADPTTIPARVSKINPTNFRLEPRHDATFAERRYFSLANMTTENHIAVLTSLDRDWSVGK